MRAVAGLAITAALLGSVCAQPSPEELAPLLAGLDERLPYTSDLERRVPLSTNDNTSTPLIDLQVFAPPVVPHGGSNCVVQLLGYDFGEGSYDAPAVVAYTPPTSPACGKVGEWAAISLNLSVYSIGTQYDRLSSLYLNHVEIWRHSSAEPTKTGTIWTTVKDVTHYTALFAESGDLLMDFSNIISTDLALDGVFHVTITATFYASSPGFKRAHAADVILPLSNLSPNHANYFTLTSDAGIATNVTLPPTTQSAFVEVYASGNSAEEFWWGNAVDEALPYFSDPGVVVAKGPFREIQVLVDNTLAGVVWPYPVIYTGGVTPTNWRPLTAYGAYDQPTHFVDLTPFLGQIADGRQHAITLKVVGQGKDAPSFNSNWFVSGSLHAVLGKRAVSGKITKYAVDAQPHVTVAVGAHGSGNATVWQNVAAARTLVIEAELIRDAGKLERIHFEQHLAFTNEQEYADEGWVQWATQLTEGTTTAIHAGTVVLRDALSYPLSVFSNYSLYEMQFGAYGSVINQTYSRALNPAAVGRSRAVRSIQHARGDVGMDDWPGLRHAINGTGATDQLFAYTDDVGQTYFRDIAAKNDGWVHDKVWGSLGDANPALPPEQIWGPGGGPGFKRMEKSMSTKVGRFFQKKCRYC